MSWLTEIPKVLWFAVPVLIAAAVQIVVIKLDVLKFLKMPLCSRIRKTAKVTPSRETARRARDCTRLRQAISITARAP